MLKWPLGQEEQPASDGGDPELLVRPDLERLQREPQQQRQHPRKPLGGRLH